MLTIDNFESVVSATIIERGKQYFENVAVASLEENPGGVWTASVEGSEMYEVEVQLKGRKIQEYYCDCPYDGEICKHTVAVLYSLREQLAKPAAKPVWSGKMTFEEVLLKTDLEELRAFIRYQKQQNRHFAEQFTLFFAEKNPQIDIKGKYEGLVRQVIRNNSSRGFMDYRQTSSFAREIKPILQAVTTAISQKNYRDALTIGWIVCQETMSLIQNCDDSAGRISDVMYSAIELLNSIAKANMVSPKLLEQLFDTLEKALPEKQWFDYGDFGYDLLDVAEHAALRIQPDRYIKLLDILVEIHTGTYAAYEQEHFKRRKIRFYVATNRLEEAEKLSAEHMDIVEVRQNEVQKAIQKGEFARAKQLIAEGIQIAEQKKHPGTVRQWEVELLYIARKEKDLATERYFTKKFAFDRGLNIQYYQEWKATFSAADWPSVIESHIQSVIEQEKNKPRSFQWDTLEQALYLCLSPVFIQEEQWARLFEVAAQVHLETVVDEVHPYLCKRYPAEMLAAYLNKLEKSCKEASSRSVYTEIARQMKLVKKDIAGSHDAINDLVNALIKKYPHRPAMLEEFASVL